MPVQRIICSDCVFFRPVLPGSTPESRGCGECRKYAPRKVVKEWSVQVFETEKGTHASGVYSCEVFENGLEADYLWPLVSREDWCGESVLA